MKLKKKKEKKSSLFTDTKACTFSSGFWILTNKSGALLWSFFLYAYKIRLSCKKYITSTQNLRCNRDLTWSLIQEKRIRIFKNRPRVYIPKRFKLDLVNHWSRGLIQRIRRLPMVNDLHLQLIRQVIKQIKLFKVFDNFQRLTLYLVWDSNRRHGLILNSTNDYIQQTTTFCSNKSGKERGDD